MTTVSKDAPVCPLCGGQGGQKVFTERAFDLLSCPKCALLFIDPYPGSVNEHHAKVVDYAYQTLKVADVIRHEAAEQEMTRLFFPKLAAFVTKGTKLLDVGCGTGTLMSMVKEAHGAQCEGIELNQARCRVAQAKGFVVHNTPVELFSSDVKYDCITLINVLSHIPDLDRLFHALRHLCAPTGVIVLKVGEIDRTVSKYANLDWGIPDHLHFLGPGTVDIIAQKYGMKVVLHDRWPYSSDLFSRNRFAAPGRSDLRNFFKKAIIATPFALKILRSLYDLRFTSRGLSSSLIVLRPF